MERNATVSYTALLLLLLAVTAPAASAAKLVVGKAAAWVEDEDVAAAVGMDVLQLQAMMMVAASSAAAAEVHRRVLQAQGGYVNQALEADHQRCLGSCPPPGGSYTGRGNKCYYQNKSCS
ncbi:uncharacterized protein LOC121054295 [Oryza brachyantha]|uniref:Uncharacterized protein n=1 Tax=Oryza brachyantha TaxID=4533 RepID=J3LX76_ORYBR|nr:uncharacterized protein LOC121054295 [Oryza brachyantha]